MFISLSVGYLLGIQSICAGSEELGWQVGEGLRGVDETVRTSIIWDRDGQGGEAPVMVIGGNFNIAGTVVANAIALWNGNSWEPLGSGLGGEVRDLAVLPNGDLVAGGGFRRVGDEFISGVARWDGVSWSGFGEGIGGLGVISIQAVEVHPNGDLIVGGAFMKAGNVDTNSLARWDGTEWHAFGAGLGRGAIVNDIAVLPNGDIVVTGAFTIAGEATVANIARWDGEAWWALGAGLGGHGHDFQVLPNGDLAVAGGFSSAGGVSTLSRVAIWDGNEWSAVGEGAGTGHLNETVFDLALMANGDLIAGGAFWTTGSRAPANFVARWNGSEWLSFGEGPANFVTSLLMLPNGDLVAGGLFTSVDGVHANHIARWDGSRWHFYGSGIGVGSSAATSSPVIHALLTMPDGTVIAGGDFNAVGNISANHIARWNGSSWFPLGSGTDGVVHALALHPNGDLIVAGMFKNAGDQLVNSIARWRDDVWSALGTGVGGLTNPTVHALAILPSGDLVVSGLFTNAGGVSSNQIALWNGEAWEAFGAGIRHTPFALAVMPNGDLIAGGSISQAGGVSVNRIVRWDGAEWSEVGGGTNGQINALAVLPNGDLVAGGNFGTAGGVLAPRIARWDGSEWSAFANGMSGGAATVHALTVLTDGDVLAAGRFGRAGTATVQNVARWNGEAWTAVGTGTDKDVFALAPLAEGTFVIGGIFTSVNDRVSAYFAHWGCPFSIPVGVADSEATLRVDLAAEKLTFYLVGDAGELPWVLQHSQDGIAWEDLIPLESIGNESGPTVEVALSSLPESRAELGLFRAIQRDDVEPEEREFREARTRWENASLGSYRYEVRSNWSFFTWHGTVTVIDGEVTASEKIMAFPEDIEPLELLTIDGFFDKVANAKADGAEVVDVTWHPELGYPESGFIDISMLIADEEQSWTILSLSPLD
jgi:trimeric autotransporter adhesin